MAVFGKISTMQEINDLLRQLDGGGDLSSIRSQIINLIFNDINRRRDSLDTWERMHFATRSLHWR
jgi:hypothetical protein